MSEFTVKAVVLGIVLALIMCAANTYLGLYAGMTVSASIPAAVISMGILRGIMRRGTILENNIVQTAASTGESLAAGIIFTIPALVITGVWQTFGYWTTTMVALLGGLLGVLLMIPMRKTLIVESKELSYPEGVACAEVLKAGETGGKGAMYVFFAMVVGAVFKFLVAGFSLIKSKVEYAICVGKTALYIGADMSVALVGVGYIVGFNIAVLVFIGGAIGWLIGIPIYGLIYGLPVSQDGGYIDAFNRVWAAQIRYIGVGAMVVGGIWSIISIRHSIIKGFKETLSHRNHREMYQDLSGPQIIISLLIVGIPLFILYGYLTRSFPITIVAGVSMLVTAVFFVAVSSYIVGLVGSSNNPVSGMTIITLLFASILLVVFRMSGVAGILASLGVAGVVCCAACTAGDISQDLKTGHLVGATPKWQEVTQLISVIIPAFIIAPVLIVLHQAYGIGTGKPGSLAAPQASLFASISTVMFTDKALPWNMVLIGIGIGLALISMDEILKRKGSIFRTYVMPTAVGIYLPLVLSVPILIGGIIRKITHESKTGILFSSGLIAGESIMGIIIAFLIVSRANLPISIIESNIVSILSLLAVIVMLGLVSIKSKK